MWFVHVYSIHAECRTIHCPNVSIFPSEFSHKDQVCMFYLSSLISVNTQAVIAIYMSLLMFLFVYANWKMFTIPKSKRSGKRVAHSFETSVNNNRKTRIINLKSVATCSLAVGCFSLVPAGLLYIQFYALHQ